MLEKMNGGEIRDFGDFGPIPPRPFNATNPLTIEDIMRNAYSKNASDADLIEKSRHFILLDNKQTALIIGGTIALGVVGSIAISRLAHRH